jgi:hypothetical protein
MRRSVQLAAVGIAALLAVVGTAAAQSASTGTGAVASAATTHHDSSPGTDVCRLTATSRELNAPRIALRSAISKRSVHTAGGGTVEATIPAAVFIRAAGRQLTITTNTGRSPREGDQFYLVTNGRAGMASNELKHRVIARCA